MSILKTTPRQDGFSMPAEWAPQAAVWMIWPYRDDNWRRNGLMAQSAYAKVAEAISIHTQVNIAVPSDSIDYARKLMPKAINLVEVESDDAWCRDTGPTVVIKDHERRAIDWKFNAYGGEKGGLYNSWDQDSKIAKTISANHGFDVYEAPIILEGGSIHVDGEGTCLTTEECLLNPNRNPGYTKEQLEEILKEYLNVSKVIWLTEGVFEDETSGHIDNMACFVKPGEVILTWTDDENDPQYERSKKAYEVLINSTDAQGRKLKVWKITQPGPLFAKANEVNDVVIDSEAKNRLANSRLGGSYVNFLISNNTIIYPLLDPKTDAKAQKVFEEIFKGYSIIGVPGREILLGGGCIHCITQQIPA
ncbi:MAG: agmatine deiminase [Psittacicella sp.]